ncbi:MAG: 50S ribosomal protein L22 [bacterium]|nr:50S ribosomal protein L22 [bacterium]
MGMQATLRHCRMSARKLRLVADAVRGKGYNEAVGILTFLPKQKAAGIILKLLKSAAANVEETSEFDPEELVVRSIQVNGARMMKRFRPAPQGRAVRIRKRMSHITLELGPSRKGR